MKKSETNEVRSNPAILIVDDLPKNIQIVAKFLTDEGYNLFFAQNGEAALKLIKSRSFDLILLDVMMPTMDGFEVCSEIKKNDDIKDIPIIFLTAKADEQSFSKGFALGGVDYITKPFNPVELLTRVKNHIKLRQHEKELLNLNKTKDLLLSVISHDLKVPFYNIISLGEMLLGNFESVDNLTKKEIIANIVESSRSSYNLLDNLLNWTRLQTGRIAFHPERVDLNQVIGEVMSFIRSQAMNKEVHCEVESLEEIYLNADVNMLQAIIRNLVSNAIKYTPRGGSVILKTMKDGRKIKIVVSDTGIGMSKEKSGQLLTNQQIESTPGTENEPGTGFGLLLINEFIKIHNGDLEIESTLKKGTSFIITLPVDTM